MAQIRRVTRSNPLSNFQQAAPSTGGAFRFLAGAAEEAYEFLKPGAVKEMEEYGSGVGNEIVKQQIGDPQGAFTVSRMGESSGFREALGRSESGGRYGIVNSEGFTGKYQWGQARLDDFNRANGTSFSLEQFRQSPEVQERAQAWHEGDILGELGGYVGRTVNGQVIDEGAIIAMAHLGGKGGARKFIETGGAYNPADSNGTRLSDYASRFSGTSITTSTSGAPERLTEMVAGGAIPLPVTTASADRPPEERKYEAAQQKLDATLKKYAPRALDRRANFDPIEEPDAPSRTPDRRIGFEPPTGRRPRRQGEFEPLVAPPPVSFDEWRGMSRRERESRGLPVSTVGGQLYFGRFWAGMSSGAQEESPLDEAMRESRERIDAQPEPREPARPSLFDPIEGPSSDEPAEVRAARFDLERKAKDLAALLQKEWKSGNGATPKSREIERTLAALDDLVEERNAPRETQVAPARSTAPAPAPAPSRPAPTMIRDADGALVARLFSPMSDPILQVANAAAGVAYQSGIMLKAQTDLMDLSRQYALDPDSFAQAAQGYMSDLVKAAPAMFKDDIRGAVQQEVQRRFLGMVDEKHRDIRQRANNQSAALVDRWTDTLSQAIVGGNELEIEAARAQLDGLLRARESLPGLSWTPEQSQNVILKAQEAAQKEVQRRQAEQVKTWKGDLSLIRDAAKDGRRAADEGILGNPLVQQAMPDEWAEAAAFVMLRDELPSFNRMTPAEQRAALEEMRSADVQQDFELDLFAAAETAAKANAKAWEDDPIKRAAEVLPEPPPPIVNFDAQNPSEFVEALADRNAYGMKLVENGYVDVPAFLSKEEAETIGGLMGKETPPELRAVMAAAMVEGFGENAVQVFKEIKNDDPTTRYAGMLMARGGDKAVAFEAMRGQSLLDEGLVQAPSVSTSLEAISPDIAAALATVPINAQGELRKFAVSIYAARARGVMDASEQKTLMQDAVQAALGQSTNRRGQVTGGVQTLGGQPVLLPPGIAGERAEEALARAFTGRMPTISAGRIALGNVPLIGRMTLPDGQVDPEMWGDGGPPMLGGQPVDGKLFANGNVRLVPTSGTSYRIEVVTSGSVLDAHNAAGGIFEFDMQSLVDGVPVQPSIGNEPRTPRELGGR